MSKRNAHIESYLEFLNSSLRPFPEVERKEILDEIRSHIVEAIERRPNEPIGSILQAIGSPDEVALRYLTERGIKIPLSIRYPKLRFWTGFTLAAFIAVPSVWYWRSATIQPSATQEFVVKPIDPTLPLDQYLDQRRARDKKLWSDFMAKRKKENEPKDPYTEVRYKTTFDLGKIGKYEIRMVKVSFQRTAIKVIQSESEGVSYDCSSLNDESPYLRFDSTTKTLGITLDGLEDGSCELGIPANLPLDLKGDGGVVTLFRTNFPIGLDLDEGEAWIHPQQGLEYTYDLRVTEGSVENLLSSSSPNAYPIRIRLRKGSVRRG